MKILFIISDAPYGSEKAWNALRLAKDAALVPGMEVSTMGQLAAWTAESDKSLVF